MTSRPERERGRPRLDPEDRLRAFGARLTELQTAWIEAEAAHRAISKSAVLRDLIDAEMAAKARKQVK